jgi:hypothetical protein
MQSVKTLVCLPQVVSTHSPFSLHTYLSPDHAMNIPEACLGVALVVIYSLCLILLIIRPCPPYRNGIWILFVAGAYTISKLLFSLLDIEIDG